MKTRLALTLLSLFVLMSSAVAGPLYLVRDGKPVATIVTPDDAPIVITETVQDMVDIIERMSVHDFLL